MLQTKRHSQVRQCPALEEPSDVPLDECWVVSPQLFFSCHLRPMGRRQPKWPITYDTDDIQVQLVFFSTFEPVVLPGGCPMEAVGVQKLYEPSPTPILYVGPAANVPGHVPFSLLGNSTPTIPYQLRQHLRVAFPYGLADAADASGKKGSNIYEVNTWLWEFGLGKPRLGCLSVPATEMLRISVMKGGKEGRGNKGSQEPQGSEGCMGPWRNGMISQGYLHI